ncbi:galactose-1-phosphate uridylyltransferase [Chloroflexus islandicus]|uniref:Galactose-1-phosphate uridylyltransferase n=1 Tax=Chloroflexus islandicus TaxID=1707952 RepID=A0A178MB03_9CHLR|nr:UDP-glucose--hexose-1-phosphate uridylyltransferase [Chloroflexus islandicus]OAN45208.1 galactose-1-phosphate uridylyltransferase [Chloroflexus islandicus]
MRHHELFSRPHRRLNQLTGEWVLVSPHRTQRPWLGQVETLPPAELPAYDPNCYLCPGNTRANGAQNPAYTETFVFENDFAALLPDIPLERVSIRAPGVDGEIGPALLHAEAERGICRVVCFSPRHDLTLAQMSQADVRRVVEVWAEQYRELGEIDWVQSVLIFENRGAMMGASNPHPHGQIWANEQLPNEMRKELATQTAYWHEHNRCLLCDYLALELAAGERIVCANETWVALAPFWAVWPFETLVLPRSHTGALPDLDEAGREGLAAILRELTARYDRLFNVTFPYSMGFHQRPTDGLAHDGWHLHAHFYPPLLRSATVRKFMVGYEMLGQPQRDLTPEQAAERLREI